MSESPFAALSYALVAKGYRVFPVAPYQKFPAKYESGQWKPMHDWHDIYSTRKPTTIELDFWRLYYPEDSGIGLLLGEGSGLVALDFDYDFHNMHKKIEDLIEESPLKKSGQKGYTAFYRYNGERTRSWQMRGPDNNMHEVLALLSNGRQTVLPPTIHPSGTRYEWWSEDTLENFDYDKLPFLPDDFVEKMDALFGKDNVVEKAKSAGAQAADVEFGPTSLSKARDALRYIDPDTGYQEWLEIGMGLKDYFGDDGFELWDQWSSEGAKYKHAEIARKWKSFHGSGCSIASLFHYAMQRGYVNIPETEHFVNAPVVIVHGGNLSLTPEAFLAQRTSPVGDNPGEVKESWEIAAEARKINQAATISEKRSNAGGFVWEDHEPGTKKYLFNEAPGLVGKISRWMTSTAIYPDPILNMACAIAMMGVVKSHRVQTVTGLRSNMYTMGIAPSGTGKDHARKCVSKLLAATKQSTLLAGQPASSSGLFAAVYKNSGRTLILADEFGKVLAGMTGKNAQGHMIGIPTLMMELFSSSSTSFIGMEYANRDGKNERTDIEQPCLSMYATTTPEPLYEAMSSTQAIDGFLSRWLLFETKDFPVEPKKRDPLESPPEHILMELGQWRDMPTNFAPEGNLDAAMTIKPRIIKYTETAGRMAEAFQVDMRRRAKDHLDRGTGMHAIFTRTAEHAAKLALVAFDGQMITEEVYDWACQLALDRSLYLMSAVRANVADSKHEADLKKVLKIIERAGEFGISVTDLTRRSTTLKSKERNEILTTLITAELIEPVIMETISKKGTHGYRCRR